MESKENTAITKEKTVERPKRGLLEVLKRNIELICSILDNTAVSLEEKKQQSISLSTQWEEQDRELKQLEESEDLAVSFFLPEELNINKKEQGMFRARQEEIEHMLISVQEEIDELEEQKQDLTTLLKYLKKQENIVEKEKEERRRKSKKKEKQEKTVTDREDNRENIKEAIDRMEEISGDSIGQKDEQEQEENQKNISQKERNFVQQKEKKNRWIIIWKPEENVKGNRQDSYKIEEDEIDGERKERQNNKWNLAVGDYGYYFLIQNDDKKNIAQQLNNCTLKSLEGIIHKVGFIEKIIDSDKLRAKLELHTIEDTLKHIVVEIRNLVGGWKDNQLETFEIKENVFELVNRIKKDNKIQIQYMIADDSIQNVLVKIILYQMIQRISDYIIQYAKSDFINMKLDYTSHNIILEIQYNNIPEKDIVQFWRRSDDLLQKTAVTMENIQMDSNDTNEEAFSNEKQERKIKEISTNGVEYTTDMPMNQRSPANSGLWMYENREIVYEKNEKSAIEEIMSNEEKQKENGEQYDIKKVEYNETNDNEKESAIRSRRAIESLVIREMIVSFFGKMLGTCQDNGNAIIRIIIPKREK